MLRDLGFSHVGQKTRMGGAALGVVHPCFGKAEFAVYGVVDLQGIVILLPIVLPPANRAQLHRARRFQRSESAAGASKAECHGPHAEIDGIGEVSVYRNLYPRNEEAKPIRDLNRS